MNGSQNPFGGNATPAASGPANGLAANKADPNAAATPNPIIGFGSTYDKPPRYLDTPGWKARP